MLTDAADRPASCVARTHSLKLLIMSRYIRVRAVQAEVRPVAGHTDGPSAWHEQAVTPVKVCAAKIGVDSYLASNTVSQYKSSAGRAAGSQQPAVFHPSSQFYLDFRPLLRLPRRLGGASSSTMTTSSSSSSGTAACCGFPAPGSSPSTSSSIVNTSISKLSGPGWPGEWIKRKKSCKQ